MKGKSSYHGKTSSIWGFGGGKGGVGKSVTALNVAAHLALEGRKVVLVDGDLGSPNLHTLLGLRNPDASLSSFINREIERLEDALFRTSVPGLCLIPGSRDTFGAANPKYLQKQRFLRHLHSLEADEVVLDLGAGTSFHTLDLFNAVTHRVVVVTPEPTSLQNAYGFIKMALYRQILSELGRSKEKDSGIRFAVAQALEGDETSRVRNVPQLLDRLEALSPAAAPRLREILRDSRVSFIVNMATDREGAALAHTLTQVSREFLQIQCVYAGSVESDSAIVRSIRQMRPYLMDNRYGFRAEEIGRIRRAVEQLGNNHEASGAGSPAPAADQKVRESGRLFHAQTKDVGRDRTPVLTRPTAPGFAPASS